MGPRNPKPGKSFAELKPVLAKEWHPILNGVLTPKDVTSSSNHKAHWLCLKEDCGHTWAAVISSRSIANGCPSCSGRAVTSKNNLAILKPDLAKEWHPTLNGELDSSGVTAFSNRKAHWLCQKEGCGHTWVALIYSRSNGRGCPACSGRAVTPINNLAVLNPILAKEWHPTLNGELTPNEITACSRHKAHWLCLKQDCSHTWTAAISSRSRGNGCPGCAGWAITPINNLAFLYPVLASEWHPTLNRELTPNEITAGSTQKVHWLCLKEDCGHSWVSTVANRSNGSGCPWCSEFGYRIAKPGYVYILANRKYLKIGISNIPKKRTKSLNKVHHSDTIWVSSPQEGISVCNAEKEWKSKASGMAADDTSLDGHTETFSFAELPQILRILLAHGIINTKDFLHVEETVRDNYG